jgi:cell division protein ZapE
VTIAAPSSAAGQTVAAHYELECARLGYRKDPAQEAVVALLDDLRGRLLARTDQSLLNALLRRRRKSAPERGLYVWGGVGRGKTWLMDLFFHSLPFREKQRSHFHRFMQFVHDELKKERDRSDPLEQVAEKIARRARVLCFDEFFVSDIADAMLLANLLDGLFRRGVSLVATSNVAPDDLYRDGLQRARFLPAIQLLNEHTVVHHMPAGADYRLRMLERASTWIPADVGAEQTLARFFEDMAGESGKSRATITLNHRRLHVHRQAEEVIWFTFRELCDGPRSQADYIEIARCFHTVLLSDVPVLDPTMENQARRFISLVDEFYDRAVKLFVSAHATPDTLYTGSRLNFEFERTVSRLTEMQSQAYLARPHQP